MGNTIKSKQVIAYKGMNSDMTCRDFKYEVGKSYKTDKAELCKCGFHACLNPLDVLDYYYQDECSRYFRVKLSGEITKCDFDDTKVTATEITILELINIDEVINTTEWWKNNNVLDLLYWSEGFAIVKRGDGLWNFIDKKGKLLSEQWFKWAEDFKDGFAVVQRGDNLCNFIDKNGKILSEQWFKWLGDFKDGLARVQRSDRLWNFIDKKGKILSNEWFKSVDYFNKDGFARVQRKDSKWNFITKDGKIISDEWFKSVEDFQ